MTALYYVDEEDGPLIAYIDFETEVLSISGPFSLSASEIAFATELVN